MKEITLSWTTTLTDCKDQQGQQSSKTIATERANTLNGECGALKLNLIVREATTAKESCSIDFVLKQTE